LLLAFAVAATLLLALAAAALLHCLLLGMGPLLPAVWLPGEVATCPTLGLLLAAASPPSGSVHVLVMSTLLQPCLLQQLLLPVVK
jgi:hypothetical protein